MTRTPPARLRVAVAVPPRILADALCSLLGEDAAVEVVVDRTDERYDLAITVADGPEVAAEQRIVLDDAAEVPGGAIVVEQGSQRRLPDLDAVVAFTRRAARRDVGH